METSLVALGVQTFKTALMLSLPMLLAGFCLCVCWRVFSTIFIKALYYYKHTGFNFLRVYIIVAFAYYALCSFLSISSLATLTYKNSIHKS